MSDVEVCFSIFNFKVTFFFYFWVKSKIFCELIFLRNNIIYSISKLCFS